ncbi:uncharacterized protein DUF4129 [Ulvibacter sp. MAR_2010_11]|uniref:DUF4129 domain-containing protein n=1 Tax=Ulvibacter sp. MAR_2010_11 TaxID=1250229 RepID=UPI000C2CAAD4|nr:DUF4129 domain-containing protein [Ulvibacter sp. MAR_2010_11]PKA83846.1 uncharacterized protein DUF4129 [Ulvibacter sp. MAR_2010_11]
MLNRILFLFLLCCFSEGHAQDSLEVPQPTNLAEASVEKKVQYDTDSEVTPMDFNRETLENFKNDEAFDYTEIKPDEDNWWAQFKRWLRELWYKFWDWLLPDYANSPFWFAVIKALPYLIIAGIIFFVVWLFYRLNPGAKILKSQAAPDVFFTEEEEIIRTKDIKNLIQKALENHDYRLAVRYYYLLILKKLSNAELIEYEFDKTNSDYIAEILSEDINFQFRKATLLYDYIWYGNFTVTETDYQKAAQTFTKLEHQIPEALD